MDELREMRQSLGAVKEAIEVIILQFQERWKCDVEFIGLEQEQLYQNSDTGEIEDSPSDQFGTYVDPGYGKPVIMLNARLLPE